ncbi:MAG: lipopolysaccharide transport periplasmic protein LptA [Pseudomonadota bacterium]|nr:lipopolysaccharide transport periplasmic protein LptA [Pseudomonadota bacterium]
MSSTPDNNGLRNNNHSANFLYASFILPIIILSMLFNPTWADQPSQPIQISADNAQSISKLGQTIYRGNVIVEQGSLLLRGDMVTVITLNNSDMSEENQEQHSAIEAIGKPALFHHYDSSGRITVKAEAKKLDYFIESGIIRLQGNASIDQAGYIVTGDRIEYSTHMRSIKAKTNPENTNTRVHTVIKPKSSHENMP